MRQILLHPGFHKTGTSSIQHFLWLNRETLAPYFDIRMFRHMKPVVRVASLFSRSRNPLDLLDMVSLLDDVFDTHPVHDDRDLVISGEGLSGHLPGAPGVKDYDAVPTLMTYVAGYLAEKFPDAQVKLLFTTRNPDDWLLSAYHSHLRNYRMSLDYKSFATTFQSAANLDTVIADVAKALDPLPVMFMPMADAITHPLGPGAALVDLMEVPKAVRDGLQPVGIGNAGPSVELAQKFLTLNRSDLPDKVVTTQRNELALSANLGGWRAL